MGLFDLLAALEPVEVTLRGGTKAEKIVRLAPLPARWSMLARSAFPQPRPKKAINPNVGSASPDRFQEDYGDPKYRIEYSEWEDCVRAGTVAMAALLAEEPGAAPPEPKWIVEKATGLREKLTSEELLVLWHTLVEAGSPAAANDASPLDGELFGGLIRELRAADVAGAGAGAGADSIPSGGYVWDEAGLLMEACAMYGQSPVDEIPRLTPNWKRLYCNHVRLRMELEKAKSQ